MIDQLTTGLRFYQSANADATSIKEDFIIRIIIGKTKNPNFKNDAS